jgi:hypothetical protein
MLRTYTINLELRTNTSSTTPRSIAFHLLRASKFSMGRNHFCTTKKTLQRRRRKTTSPLISRWMSSKIWKSFRFRWNLSRIDKELWTRDERMNFVIFEWHSDDGYFFTLFKRTNIIFILKPGSLYRPILYCF